MSNFNPVTRIKVFGVGGGGCNAVNRMVEANLIGVDFYVVNTDRQVLYSSPVENKILIGSNTTGGLGAGGSPEVGKAAALESIDEIKEAVKDTDLIFITAGLGGGTGTGAGPVLAECAQETGALTIGIVTKPFRFEGKKRTMQAINGLDELRKHVDSLIIIPNEKVGTNLGSFPINQAFLEADNVLRQAVQTITDLISYNALINLDFADVRSVLDGQGTALIGVGEVDASEVENKEDMARLAAERAVNCPLLEANIQGAKNAIINVSGAASLTIDNAEAAVGYVNEVAGNEIDTVFGVAYNEALGDRIIVTVIATGFDQVESQIYEKASFEPVQDAGEQKDDFDMPSFVTNRRR
ncbi:MAG TPA: cell division protein FtsZ [Erysipelotrichaceae bacterium]|jgi:cell division protein FtsZ|nr:cell division protein FtsZ [Erysipelotrichia bacterium]HPX32641.1 cell division protein FtsZ [Erysipelotrichaceae bacterium]HQA85264.1 cell division protein FtsZ [Erysipelotrichaceae bacterium]